MARVELVGARSARPEVQQIYEHRLAGRPANVHKAMAHNPQALTPFLAFYAAVGKSLDRKLWEMVYLRVSFLNGCEYCVQHHVASSKKVGLGAEEWAALRSGQLGNFGEAEQAAVRYAEKLTVAPGQVSDSEMTELKKYFNDLQIVDLHLLVGLANLTNRFTGPLGLELEFAGEDLSG
jgi:uncharacterized peroxidase-related enzyme